MPSSKIQKTGSRKNFWTPLQMLDNDDESDVISDMDSEEIVKTRKPYVSPIKVLAQNSEAVIKLLNDKKLTHYLVKKISIGVKILCETIETFNLLIVILLENKFQFFVHDHKNNKPFKAVIRGLDGKTDTEVKNELISLGLKCNDVKVVKINIDKYCDTIYIVHFERGSVKLQELKKNVRSLFHIIITWDYHRKQKNRPVQCRKCQMFGHGEKGCNVKPRCANCAEKHNTIDCKAVNKFQCANCGNKHKSTDLSCPSRSSYLELREKLATKSQRPKRHVREFNTNTLNFPAINRNVQNTASSVNTNWRPSHNNNNIKAVNNMPNVTNAENTLFTEEELLQLTSEMISKLRNCTNKEQQFNAIAQLAIKFVYNSKP